VQLYLVRHGETEWNLQRRIQGSTDIPLNDTGRDQARETGRLLARRSWDAIYASPLERAFETATIIAAEVGLPAPIAVPELVERNYGAVEGMTGDEIEASYPNNAEVPGREERDAVVSRVLPALLEIANRHSGQSVLVVGHGGVIRSILGAVDPDGTHGMISNGSVHSLKHEDGTFELIAFDDPIEEESLASATDDLDAQNALEGREHSHTAAE
jgi:probable phosphoglycerate mutase